MSSLRSSKCAEERPNSAPPGRPVLAQARRRLARSSAPSRPALPSSSGWARSTSGQRHSRPCRSRSSECRNGEPTAIGCTAEQWSWSSPGTVSSLVRVPPPIVSAASSTVTPTPVAGQRDRAGQPVRAGADDDRVAQATGGRLSAARAARRRPRPGSRRTRRARAAARPCRRPRPSPPRPGRSPRRRSGSAGGRGRGGGLGLERDHPHLARLEPAALLDRVEQLLAVEMAVAEVPAVDDVGDQLALAHVVGLDVVDGVRQQRVQRPAVRVHARGSRGPC